MDMKLRKNQSKIFIIVISYKNKTRAKGILHSIGPFSIVFFYRTKLLFAK